MELLRRAELGPDQSLELDPIDPRDYPGPDDSLAGDLAIYLVAWIGYPLVEPLVDGVRRESQGARYKAYVRIW